MIYKMSTLTKRLNLVQPSFDDDNVEQTLIDLALNFKIIDDNYDEIISNVETYLTSGLVYDSGKKYWNRIPSLGGFAGWTNIRTGVFAPKWKRQTTYSIGDKVVANSNNGHYYECISGGTSALNEPLFITTSNGSFHDLYGYDIWKPSYNYSNDDIVISTVGDKSYYYKCILSGTSDSTEPSWINIAGSTIIDGGCQWYAYKTVIWEEKGISCEFVPFGTIGADNKYDARKNIGATGKYVKEIGDGASRTFTIDHNLKTQDVVVSIREVGAQANIIQPASLKVPDMNSIIVEFSTAPTTNQYKVIIIG